MVKKKVPAGFIPQVHLTTSYPIRKKLVCLFALVYLVFSGGENNGGKQDACSMWRNILYVDITGRRKASEAI